MLNFNQPIECDKGDITNIRIHGDGFEGDLNGQTLSWDLDGACTVQGATNGAGYLTNDAYRARNAVTTTTGAGVNIPSFQLTETLKDRYVMAVLPELIRIAYLEDKEFDYMDVAEKAISFADACIVAREG